MEVCADDAGCLVDSSTSVRVDNVAHGWSVPTNSFVQSVLQAFRWVEPISPSSMDRSLNGIAVVPDESAIRSSVHVATPTLHANQSTISWPFYNLQVHSASGVFLQIQSIAGVARATLTSRLQRTEDGWMIVLFVAAVAVCALGLFSFVNSKSQGRRSYLSTEKEPRLSNPALHPSPRPLPNARASTMSMRAAPPPSTSIVADRSRGSAARLPSSTTSVTGGPGFVVPQGRVCYLVVRPVGLADAPRWGYGPAKIEIVDLKGNPMLEGQVKRPIQWRDEGPDPIQTPKSSPAIMLHMLQSGAGSQQQPRSSLVAMGYPSLNTDGQRMMVLYDSNGMYLGSVSLDSSQTRYVLTAGNSANQIIFEGNFSRYEVRISSQNSVRLAHTVPCNMPFEPTGQFYRVSVTAGSDVPLIVRILCSMISIEEMELGR